MFFFSVILSKNIFKYKNPVKWKFFGFTTKRSFGSFWAYWLFPFVSFRLTQFYLWPTGDEALHGFLAVSLLKSWNWQFFYTVGEHPPLLIWMLALLFDVFKSSFAALWFLPAIFSIVTIPVGYLCAREFLSKSASALFCFFLAFSFWPVYFGLFLPSRSFHSLLGTLECFPCCLVG